MHTVARKRPAAQQPHPSRDATANIPGTSQLIQLQALATGSAPTRALDALQARANIMPLQLYTKTRADDGGYFIGVAGACHLHVEISKPHFKYGKDKGTRINFGRDMHLHLMQGAYDELKANYQGKTGYDDCIEYLEEMGCKTAAIKTLVEIGVEQGRYPPVLRRGQQYRDESGTIHTK